MNYGINTNISEIPKTKSLFFDTSHYNNNLDFSKHRPITSRIKLTQKKFKIFMPKSPRMQNYGYTTKFHTKLFSLLDIKDKNLSKSPNLPNQYKRKIYSNIYNLLYNKSKRGLIFKIPQIEPVINKSKTIPDDIQKIKMKKNKSKSNIDKMLLTMSRKERLYKPHCWDSTAFEEIKRGQRDKFMPEGYEFYVKKLLENNKNYIKNNYVKINKTNIKENKKNSNPNYENNKLQTEKEPILIRKLNKLNQYKSNIFFIEKGDNNKIEENQKKINDRKIIYYKYLDSDIFNQRHECNIIKKSGEHSFFEGNKTKKEMYNSNNETLLGWKLRKPMPSFLNYTTSQFHLFNRDMKNTSKTKENIINEVKAINKNFNPTHKQKGLTEFIELSSASASNINVDYNKAISENPNIFKKKNNISSEFNDIYSHYINICDKPFQKFNIINGSK